MIIAAEYSFNDGSKAVSERYPRLLAEIEGIIGLVDASKFKLKQSTEKTMMGQMLYAPKSLNRGFKEAFLSQEWQTRRVRCECSTAHYRPTYRPIRLRAGAFREMDFVKEKLGVEVQFGKCSSGVCSVAAKMTIFKKLGIIDLGVEIVPVKHFADDMSSGVSYFEQFVWDLERRGVADIDIPVLILGIDR